MCVWNLIKGHAVEFDGLRVVPLLEVDVPHVHLQATFTQNIIILYVYKQNHFVFDNKMAKVVAWQYNKTLYCVQIFGRYLSSDEHKRNAKHYIVSHCQSKRPTIILSRNPNLYNSEHLHLKYLARWSNTFILNYYYYFLWTLNCTSCL